MNRIPPDSSLPKLEGFQHPRFGDLSSSDAVCMPATGLEKDSAYQEEESILMHLTVTGRCYAQCEGCINTEVTADDQSPRNAVDAFGETDPERDTKIIHLLAERHPESIITICFYGGEPFLALDKMMKTWEIFKTEDKQNRFRYLVYTNGEMIAAALQKFPVFMKDIWVYSISIDGQEEQHNRIRKGTKLSNITDNLKVLSDSYKGHVLYWSTLRETQSLYDCFEGFMGMYGHDLVNHFFWHWAESRHPFEDFPSFLAQYGKDLEKIMEQHLKYISQGTLLPITHINELILYLITGKERGHTACGVEVSKNYDIVSGEIFPCADLPSQLSIGKMDSSGELLLNEVDLDSLIEYKKQLGCSECGVHAYCGGRCPVQVLAGSWKRSLQYCQLMRLHVGIVQERAGEIYEAIRKNGISLQSIYDRSAFLTKYTDVVP
jgi:radical SAM protein with 4Fe4S-binding SPASM domain